MRVIHVCAYYAPAYAYGGPTRSLHATCQAQQASGIDVQVFTTTAAGAGRLSAAPEGTTFEGVPVRYFELSPPARLLGAAALGPALSRALAEVDVVHLHGLFNRTIWDAAASVLGMARPFVLSPRGMLEAPALAHHRWRKQLSWRLKDRAIVRGASVLHATSPAERATLEASHPVARIVQIPNPVTVPEVLDTAGDEFRAAHGIAPDAPVVLSLGRLHRIKRLDLLAAAFLSLRQRVPAARLVIAGPDEQQLRPRLEAQLVPAHAAVHWLGAVEGRTKAAVLAAATALVQCSDSESFGMSVAEALASGTPVVVTRTCPWEVVEARRCGFWVEQTSDAIAAALHTIVTDHDLARAQGLAGRQLIRDQFSPERVADAWSTVYRETSSVSPAAA